MGRDMASLDLPADEARRIDPELWFEGQNLWRVGFHLDSLPLMQFMSGMVEIKLTAYDHANDVLVFVVRCMDKTGSLFRTGYLKANSVFRYREIDQPLLVESKKTHPGPFEN